MLPSSILMNLIMIHRYSNVMDCFLMVEVNFIQFIIFYLLFQMILSELIFQEIQILIF